jgi:hypothetical protein
LGDTEQAQTLNDRLNDDERNELGVYGTAVLSVCLDHRFRDDSSRAAIDRFVEAMRSNYAKADPPLKVLAIEGVIRAFAGEDWILDEISPEDQQATQLPIIREIVASSAELRGRIDDVLTDADQLATAWASEG